MSSTGLVDERYYQVVAPHSVSERMVIAARDRIYDDFIRYCRPSARDTIVDVGVSDVVNDAANVMARKYPRPENVTALGLGDGAAFRNAFPAIGYRRIAPNKTLPFADKTFDIATANAVLEHVGSRDRQRFFVSEMLRVARRVFISVPNRYFPVEHHTAIPLLHFWDTTFAFACARLGKDEWANAENLILMSKETLVSLAPADAVVGHTGIPLGAFSSNLFMFAGNA